MTEPLFPSVDPATRKLRAKHLPPLDPIVSTDVADDASQTSATLGTAIDSATHPLGVAARAAFGVVSADAASFGDDSTDATSYLGGLIASAASQGIAVKIPKGRYRVTGAIDIPSNSTINFDAGAVIVVGVGSYDKAVIKSEGGEGAKAALAVAAVAGSFVADVPSELASTLATGDIIGFDSVAIQYSTDVRGREIHKVASVSGTTVTLDSPLDYSYTTADAARAWKITPVENITVRGAHFFSENPDAVVSARTAFFSFGVNCHMIDTTIESGTGAITFSDCIDSSIDGVTVDRLPNLDNFEGYATVVSGASYNFMVSKIRGRFCRHAFTTLGKVYDGFTWGGPRDGKVQDSIVQLGASPYSAFDTHPEGLRVDFENCHAYGGSSNTGNGFQVRAKRSRLVNCKAIGTAARGVRVDTNTAVGTVIHGGEFAYNGLEGIGGGDFTVTGGAQIHHNTGPGILTSKGSLIQGNAIFANGNYGIQDGNTDASSNTILQNYMPYSVTQTVSVLSPKNSALIAFNTLPGYTSGGDGVSGTISATSVRTRNYTDANTEKVARVDIGAADVANQAALAVLFGATEVLRIRRGAASTTAVIDLKALTTQVINGTMQFASGGLLRVAGTYDAPFRLGEIRLWDDGTSVRWKRSAPANATDGVAL